MRKSGQTYKRQVRLTRTGTMKTNSTKPKIDAKATSVVSNGVCDTTGSLLLLNGIVPGLGINQRLSTRITLDRLEGTIEMGVTSATGTDQYQRWLIVEDRQPNGSAAAITDILESTNPNALLNLANWRRFRVLRDSGVFPLNAAAEPGSKRTFNFSLRLNSNVIFNAGTAGTIADIVTNSLHFLSVGNNVAGATAGSCAINLRLWYHNSV
jgi:hypothetical protein